MSSGEATRWPEEVASLARTARDTGQSTEARRQALSALAAAANDAERPEETRDQALCVLAEIAGEEDQAKETREEAFIGLRPSIRLIAGQIAASFSGQPAHDLLQEAESYIWERLPKFRAGRFQGWCPAVLRHLILDWLRRRKANPTALADRITEEAGEYGDTLGTAWPDITEQVTAQLAAIRQVFPAPETNGPVLLLSERLWLGKTIAASFSSEDGRMIGNQTVCEMVEIVANWEADDEARLLPREMPLSRAWQTIREQTQDRPQEAGPKLVAEVLGDSRSNWNQWVCRARTRLAQRLGPASARLLFPYWPVGVFARAAGGTEP